MAADKELVLTRNLDYTWGPKPTLDTVTVHYESDPEQQIAALAATTADIISPTVTADHLRKLSALETDGVALQQGQGLGFDQLVLNFKGVLANPQLRTAFLHTVPRADIVEQVAKPLDPDATVLNSFVFRPSQVPYKESTQSNRISTYTAPVADSTASPAPNKAKELLDGAKPTVRILYNRSDPDRVQEYSLVAAAATEAGFVVTDAGKDADSWLSALKDGAFDVALYGCTSNPTGSVQVPQIFRTSGISNLNNFSNTVVDQLTEQLAAEPDPAKQNALKMQIDQLVVEAGYGLPLFQRTGLSASGPHATGVEFSPLAIGPWQSIAGWAFVK
ncbi:ABC transporter substrate-binding protein [Arthrobacter psychrolactophilus]